MLHRYNSITFLDQKEYHQFLINIVKDNEKYFVPGLKFVFGNKLKSTLLNRHKSIRIVLTEGYINNLLFAHSLFQKTFSGISNTISRIFSGDYISWKEDILLLIDDLQNIVESCPSHLANLDSLLSLFHNILKDLEKSDIYALADNLIYLEEYFQRHINFFTQDLQYLKESGSLHHE
ncbi:MAG: hypothetical protein ACPLQO_11585 [Desulfotomaculales bacterium]